MTSVGYLLFVLKETKTKICFIRAQHLENYLETDEYVFSLIDRKISLYAIQKQLSD